MILNNINFLKSRIKLLLSSFVDLVIIHLIFSTYFNNFQFFGIGINEFFYIIVWLLLSYVFDRYYQYKLDSDDSYFRYQIINSLKSIISYVITLLIFNWALGNYFKGTFFLLFLLSLFSISSSSQYFLNKFLFRKLIKKKYWTFLISDKSRNLSDNLEFINKEKIQFLYFENIKEYYINSSNSYGIVIDNYENLTEKDKNLLLNLKKNGVKIYLLINWFKVFLKRYPPNLLSKKDFINLEYLLLTNSLLMRIKRVGDIFISILILILSLPVIIVAVILIYLEDRGPVLYSQKRTGHLNKEFTIWKLRSMRVNAEEKGVRWSSKDDNRITKIGSFLRKTRIDELPQLWSVLSGDMSLIGPRPERPEIDILLIEKIPFYSMRYLLKPGLSGWAQVNYPYGASVKDSANKLSFDLYYINNYSFWLDLLIFLRTLRLILNARGSKPN